MPLYEYACRSCARRFEEIRKFEERLQAPVCPSCGGTQTVLRLSAPGFVGAGATSAGSGMSGSADFGSCDAGGGCCGGACMH
jgi:putative FmdB family regulatory protein